MASDDDTLYLFLGFGAGFYFFFKGFRTFRKYRVLADTPVTPIRSIAMGLVEVHGKAQGDQVITSPVTHSPCFFYKVTIEKYQKDSKGRGSWRPFRTDSNGVKFHLQDETGKVLVDLDDAELDLQQSARREIGGGVARGFISSLTASEKARAARALGPSDSDLFDFVHRVASNLPANLPEPARQAMSGVISALTDLQRPDTPDERQRSLDHLRQQLRASKENVTPRQGLGAVLDLVRGSGLSRGVGSAYSDRYRLTEHCVLPDQLYHLTGTCTENPKPQDEDDRSMIVKGENEPTFLLSWRTEEGIEGHLRRKALLMILGGAVLSVVCLGVLLYKAGLF